jgi:hypothetical protein
MKFKRAESVEQMIQLICKPHGLSLSCQEGSLVCKEGCTNEVLNGIPRFVPVKNYASSFGLQWNTFRATQLDSYTGLAISHDRLARIAGGSLCSKERRRSRQVVGPDALPN